MFHLLAISVALSCVSGAVVPLHRHPSGLLPDGRIVGGVETTIEKFPYQISLRFFGSHRCGGCLHKANMIITAAHCVYELEAINLRIVAGSSYISKGGVQSTVKGIFAHEEYHLDSHDYDIALVMLDSPFDFSESIQPIQLARVDEEVRDGTVARVSGWGDLIEGGHSPDVLQYVEVVIVSNEQCKEDYNDVNDISERMMCAGHPRGGHDACQGDSGGPLTVEGRLYGIVSWGVGCARPDYPGVYVKIAAFRDWIAPFL